jgi:hypothetical protein
MLMPMQTKLSPDEFAIQGEAWYERLKSQIEPENFGRYLAVNIETGEYEVGDDFILPTERLLSREPNAELYALRVGYRAIGCIKGYTETRGTL